VENRSIILLVEDNESHALLAMRGLSQFPSKHSIIHVSDGEAALDYIFRRGEYSNPRKSPTPNLILLDLRLPRVDGIDVLREIKNSEDHRAIPVVILTSSMAEPDIVRAYFFYANSYIVKPLDFEEFRRQMLEIANYWLTRNINPL
jgi:CheY-like chemotaxis protein